MLDKTIPYCGVLMLRDNTSDYPNYNLPDGYSFCMYKKGFERDWAELETEVEEFDDSKTALKHFEKEFMPHSEELFKRCIFVKDQNDKIVATATVWFGNHFGGDTLQRIHWVSVHPKHQGRGIAKALITKAFDVVNNFGYTGKIYLTTQTWSYKAISIYLKFGFKPYLGVKPENWMSLQAGNFGEDNKNAWALIFNKINQRGIKNEIISIIGEKV